jgi:hypothetical protein
MNARQRAARNLTCFRSERLYLQICLNGVPVSVAAGCRREAALRKRDKRKSDVTDRCHAPRSGLIDLCTRLEQNLEHLDMAVNGGAVDRALCLEPCRLHVSGG